SGPAAIPRLVVGGDEITGNDTDGWETKQPGCGCTGGVRFWPVTGTDGRGNPVHAARAAGPWADTNNNDLLIEGHVLEATAAAALLSATSYTAVIRNNTIRRNDWVEGRTAADRGDTF
ncbi:lipoprotein, partial [Streptomyces rubellomurinus subsp. indigoferus]